MKTILLLCCSNIFMTMAWYGHLRFPHLHMWLPIPIGWGLAFFEYTLMVPANRPGVVRFVFGYPKLH